jgi:hypothetical protein
MADIKFVGEFSGFMFMVDGKIWEVQMNAMGYLVMMEPDIIIGEYRHPLGWEKFQAAHPEFAATMVQVIQKKMNETVQFINELRVQTECTDPLLGLAPPLKPDDDVMYHRAYQ